MTDREHLERNLKRLLELAKDTNETSGQWVMIMHPAEFRRRKRQHALDKVARYIKRRYVRRGGK